ncbi:dye-decolorizing heme-containing peroxidase [Paramarasmius palmivorus]|uniref:Dye-decolorizing heme-containing peroxidase n=1 Tax=Paramarasmius palmivorus TaxID=297713 RepID=A0AAW0C4S8_9AGAR
MRLSFVTVAIGLCTSVAAGASRVKPRRTSSILIDPDAQPKLPTANEAKVAAASEGLNLDDIQGDVLVGMKKDKELFFFFGIQDAAAFKSKLASDIHGLITSTTQLLDVALQPITAVNIAFSQSGLTTLGNTDNLNDNAFRQGQSVSANSLGDPGTGNWVQGFVGTSIHGVFLIASDTQDNVDAELANIKNILGNSIVEIHSLQGAARPGSEKGHEHFGYMDGISQPAVQGFVQNPLPGQTPIPAGVILTGEDGDSTTRPAWAKGGSFLAFRQLQQLVPEFSKFVTDNALSVPGLSAQENADLLGARMVGRWKSGAPIDLAPLRDDPVLAADPNRNNDFTYDHPDLAGFTFSTNQTLCPFGAHTRKTNPRAHLPTNTRNHIIRAGIPYGPEVTDAEATAQASSKSADLERGLAFVSYQSNIASGFAFIQQVWVDNSNFPVFTTPILAIRYKYSTYRLSYAAFIYSIGVDPIIGALNGQPRTVTGYDPLNVQKPFVLNNGKDTLQTA